MCRLGVYCFIPTENKKAFLDPPHLSSPVASPVRVLGADVAKMSSYSASSQYPPPSSGRPWSQLQNTKGVFPSRQRGRDDDEALPPERKGPANGLLARQGENLDRYRVVVLKSAPGHPLRRSSGHPEKEEEEEEALRFAGMPSGDAPQRPARRRDHAGGQSAWRTSSVVWSQPGRYVSGSRKDAHEAFAPRRSDVIQPGGFPPRGVTASAEKNPDASLFQRGPQPEKPTSSLADDRRRGTTSFFVKPSFLRRREDLGKPWHSPSVSEIERFERIPKYGGTVPAKEKDHAVHLPQNAARYPATLREHFPPHLAAYREKLWVDAVAPPAPATDRAGATTSRRPARPTPSERAGRLLGSRRSKWPASEAFAGVSPTNRGKSYGLKMANVYPPLSSKYSFGQRKVEPRTTAAPSAIGFPPRQNLERRLLKQPSHRVEGADTAARLSNGSAALQIFPELDRNALRFASTGPIPETGGPRRDEVPAFGTERNQRHRSRLFGTSASSTVRGGRVHVDPRGGPRAVAGNSPMVRRPQGELAGNATAPPTAAALPNLTKSGVGFSGSGVPLTTSPETTFQSQKSTQRDEDSSASEVFDDGTDKTLQEDLLELNYLRISTGNVSFKSI